MLNLCTLSDYNYLNKGLVLYDSLVKTSKDFVLYYLCLDSKSYEKIKSLSLPNLISFNAKDIGLDFKNDTPYNYYCWSLSSRFTNYILNANNIEDIVYIDSDIAFYHDVAIVFNEVRELNKSIGIVPHLHNTERDPNGKYNVGVVYFKKDINGMACLKFWIDCVMNPSNPYRLTHGTCGDQKYLELFEKLFQGVHVIGNKVGHGAPWNFNLYDWSKFSIENKYITFNNQDLPLVFCHYVKFVPNYKNNTYMPTNNNDDNQKYIYPISKVIKLYDEYYQMSFEAFNKYGL